MRGSWRSCWPRTFCRHPGDGLAVVVGTQTGWPCGSHEPQTPAVNLRRAKGFKTRFCADITTARVAVPRGSWWLSAGRVGLRVLVLDGPRRRWCGRSSSATGCASNGHPGRAGLGIGPGRPLAVSYRLCPSRGTNLTGPYAHNHRVLHPNANPFGGFRARQPSTRLSRHGVVAPSAQIRVRIQGRHRGRGGRPSRGRSLRNQPR